MKLTVRSGILGAIILFCAVFPAQAQELGPGFTKVKDGIYVYAVKEGNSTCSVVLTEEDPGDHRYLPKTARHAQTDGRREEADGQAGAFRHRYRGA